MTSKARSSPAAVSRRDMVFTGGMLATGFPSHAAAQPVASSIGRTIPPPDVYTRIGVRPFINCTATITINGGSLMMPEVISAVEQASYYHVNLDELMEKVGARLAELLQTEWGIVTNGTAAALTHATAACLAGTDPEKIQRLPTLDGLKNEVIMPRESRVVYDHAVRTLGVKIVEVNSPDELRAAISSHTAMIEVLGNYFGHANLDLKDVAPIARSAGIPILVDAAADYLVLPNPYIAQGADMVAYSGGKILRGPQNAGLLIGRRDLIRAAWANSAPHHSFGRALKVSKEAVMGMLQSVEIWCTQRDVHTQFKEWESWYAEMSQRITAAPGVRTEIRGPIRGGPFPTLYVSRDPAKIGLTAGELGDMLLNGEPRIMTHAQGEGYSFLIRPCAMKPGEHEIVAQRLYEIFSSAKPKQKRPRELSKPVMDISGAWEVDVQYEVGSARHKLFLAAEGNRLVGFHEGWAYQGDLKGEINGSEVKFQSALPADGNTLFYTFTGSIAEEQMSGELTMGEYGRGRWKARRQTGQKLT